MRRLPTTTSTTTTKTTTIAILIGQNHILPVNVIYFYVFLYTMFELCKSGFFDLCVLVLYRVHSFVHCIIFIDLIAVWLARCRASFSLFVLSLLSLCVCVRCALVALLMAIDSLVVIFDCGSDNSVLYRMSPSTLCVSVIQ